MTKKKLPKGMKPLGQDEEYDKKVREKCKGSSSPKRVFSQNLRRLRENPNKTSSDVYELITNPQASAAQIQELIKEALNRGLKDSDFINLINVVIRKHGTIFGNKVQLDGKLDINLKVKELELRNDCILRAIQMLVQKAKLARFYEWDKKFPEQSEEMIKHIEAFFTKEVIEDSIRKNYIARKGIAMSLEKSYNIREMPEKDMEEITSVKFELPKLTKEEDITSAHNLQIIKKEIDKEQLRESHRTLPSLKSPLKSKEHKPIDTFKEEPEEQEEPKEEEDEEEVYL
jgi:hypothetical protein